MDNGKLIIYLGEAQRRRMDNLNFGIPGITIVVSVLLIRVSHSFFLKLYLYFLMKLRHTDEPAVFCRRRNLIPLMVLRFLTRSQTLRAAAVFELVSLRLNGWMN